MQSNRLKPFILQVLISAIPGGLVIAFLPVFFAQLSLPLSTLGLTFMGIRFLVILGGLALPHALNRWAPHRLCIASEGINFLLVLGALAALTFQKPFLFVGLMVFKGLGIGIVNTCRFTWLKQLPELEEANQTQLICNALYQCTYACAGLALLTHPFAGIATAVLLLDMATSALGILFFLRLAPLSANVSYQTPPQLFSSLLYRRPLSRLILVDLLVAAAFGGSNILLVSFGQQFFGEYTGYPVALIIYGVAYGLGGLLLKLFVSLRVPTHLKKICLISLFSALGSFLLLQQRVLPYWVSLGCFAILFLAWATFLLSFETLWFEKCPRESAGATFAMRALALQMVIALGEWAYALAKRGIEIRTGLVAAAILALLFAVNVKTPPAHSLPCNES